MRVMKFGGASLRDGPAIERSARLVVNAARSGRVLLVVSAQEGVTALLGRAAEEAARGRLEAWDTLRVRHRSCLAQLGLASDLLDRHLVELRAILEELARTARVDRRMKDYVLSFGERMSARVVAATLRQLGASAAPLDAYDLGLTTASKEGEGALLAAPTPALRAQLAAVPGIPVVTGFLALDPAGHLTTLGPNGSDLTAVWFGEAVAAEEVVLWKAVAGFLSADPDVVPEARLVPVLGRREAVELAVHGAEVLHAGALEPAARGGIRVRVANVAEPDAPGSLIEAETPHAGPLAIAHRAELALYRETLSLGRDQGAQLAELTSELVATGLEPYRAAFSGAEVVALVPDVDLAEAFAARRGSRATLERGLASFAVVGRELARDATLESRVRALAEGAGAAAVPAPGATGASSLVFLVPAPALTTVVRAVHAGLFGATPPKESDELIAHPRRPARA
jgi:aspartate kinase